MSRRDVDSSEDRSNQLRRRQMVDGGEVVSGRLADEALDAVGARAMTMDHTIFVRDDFDPDNPEDQALYAHERHHQLQSGGAAEHGGGEDAEEKAAKVIERMVLDRRGRGEDFSQIMSDVRSGRTATEDNNHLSETNAHESGAPDNTSGDDDKDPMAAYRALRNQGWSHESIVRLLASHVVHELRQGESERDARAAVGPRNFG